VLAFLQHADALLKDLQSDRAIFLGDHLDVVDALLADASDKTAYRVSIKMAAARPSTKSLNLKRRLSYRSLFPACTTTATLRLMKNWWTAPLAPRQQWRTVTMTSNGLTTLVVAKRRARSGSMPTTSDARFATFGLQALQKFLQSWIRNGKLRMRIPPNGSQFFRMPSEGYWIHGIAGFSS
jgi:hypothetical protein